jgi:hypothetical protein
VPHALNLFVQVVFAHLDALTPAAVTVDGTIDRSCPGAPPQRFVRTKLDDAFQ